MLNTRTYRKLFRDTAKQHGVQLLQGTWTDGADGSGHKIVSNNRKVTFTVNTDSGDFDSFLQDLSVQTKLIEGKAPRFTTPKEFVDYVFVKDHNGYGNVKRQPKGHNFAYIKMNVRVALKNEY